jgi:hypothetical protein
MTDLATLFRRGIRLPPAGWALAGMLAFYVLAGLFGRDPWKGEDAIHIGTAWSMFTYGDWLSPDLAGRAFHEPPLYYWTAALAGKLFGWLLPLHEAMRLASGLWVGLALTGLYYAGRELYGQDNAAASPLLLAGCLGLILHAHDAQPMLVALAAYACALAALAALGRKPRLAGVWYGVAVAGCLLGAGLAPTLPLLAIAPFAWWRAADRRTALLALATGLGLAALLALPWPLALLALEPARLHGWVATELRPLQTSFSFTGLLAFAGMLPWFAFPALPLAGWTLWTRRRQLAEWPQLLPIAFLLLTLVVLAWTFRPRDIPALLLLPPVALLATPGALSLRRGAASAFDWFAMMTFTLFAGAVWVAWSAMARRRPAPGLHRDRGWLRPAARPGRQRVVALADPDRAALALSQPDALDARLHHAVAAGDDADPALVRLRQELPPGRPGHRRRAARGARLRRRARPERRPARLARLFRRHRAAVGRHAGRPEVRLGHRHRRHAAGTGRPAGTLDARLGRQPPGRAQGKIPPLPALTAAGLRRLPPA